jgi:hypothetical protein
MDFWLTSFGFSPTVIYFCVSIVQDLMLGALRGDQVSVGFRAHD